MVKVNAIGGDNDPLMPVLFGVSTSESCGSRGQSSVIGVVLVTAITVLGVTGLLLFGSTALMDARSQSQIGAAEHAMTQLDSRFSLVALGSAERQGATVDLRSGASMTIDGDKGWMNVSVYNRSSNEVDQTVLNTTLGAIEYENDDTTVAYQGGGVWKKAGSSGSVMVSPPEFHYRQRGGEDPTLTLPLVVVRGNGSVPGEATVSKAETIAKFPNASDPDRTNPLQGGQINVTVHSQYYEAWGAFFEERTGGTVEYDHDRQEVRIVLRVTKSSQNVRGGIVSGAGGTTLEFDNHADADSYNSTIGPYSSSNRDNTSIIVAGDFELGNHGKVWGNLEAGGSVTLNNHANVTGDVRYGGTLTNQGTIVGDVRSDADVNAPSAIDWLIDERRIEINSSNDNGATSNVSGDQLQNCASTCELDAGRYYLDEIDIGSGDHLLLDTSDGDVTVVVDGDVDLGDSKVEVVGGNTTRFYIEGDVDKLGGSGEVTVTDDRAPGMWFYMNPGATFTFGNGARFVGIVYGPGDGAQPGVDVDVINHVKIFGGVVGDIEEIDPHIEVHFDEALVGADPLADAASSEPSVTYMHVTVNEVNVTGR